MLRLIIISVILSFALVGGTAASSIFDQLPTTHWTYKAIRQFDCDWCPIVFQDETKVPMSRYELAVVTSWVYKAFDEQDEARDKITYIQLSSLIRLIDEFKDELQLHGLDVDEMKQNLPCLLTMKWQGLNVQEYPELAEMPEDHWAYESMKRLYELGIIEGFSF